MVTTFQNDGATPYLHLNNPFPNGLIQPAGNSLGLMNDVGFDANGPLRTPGANQTPYEQSWSLGIERELPSNIVVSAHYIGKKGTHLPFTGSHRRNFLGPWVESLPIDARRPEPPVRIRSPFLASIALVDNPFVGIITDPNSSLSSPTGSILAVAASLSAIHRSRLARNLSSSPIPSITRCSWSPKSDTRTACSSWPATPGRNRLTTPQTQIRTSPGWAASTACRIPNKPFLERSLSTFDIPHVIQLSYSYDLPIGRGRPFLGNMPRWAELIVGRMEDERHLAHLRWTSADFLTLQTEIRCLPMVTSDPTLWEHPGAIMGRTGWTTTLWITAFSSARPISRWAMLRERWAASAAPWSFTTNLSLGKQFSMRESMNIEFRIEAQNALNHPVFCHAEYYRG